MSQAKSILQQSVSNSQTPDASPPQLNTQDPLTWPPCERCGNLAPFKTQYGNLCDECFQIAQEDARRRLAVYCEPDDELCRIVARESGRNGDATLRHIAANELQRRRELQAAIDYLHEAARHG